LRNGRLAPAADVPQDLVSGALHGFNDTPSSAAGQ
jgi:hypothetical protein